MTIGVGSVTIDVGDPQLVEVEIPVQSQDAKILGDAFEVLDKALNCWEALLREFDYAV